MSKQNSWQTHLQHKQIDEYLVSYFFLSREEFLGNWNVLSLALKRQKQARKIVQSLFVLSSPDFRTSMFPGLTAGIPYKFEIFACKLPSRTCYEDVSFQLTKGWSHFQGDSCKNHRYPSRGAHCKILYYVQLCTLYFLLSFLLKSTDIQFQVA